MPHFWLKRAKIAGSAGCSSILSVSERGCQCERRQQTCKRVAKHYTIGLHKNPPSLPPSITIARFSLYSAFVLSRLICDGIYLSEEYKNLLLSERRVIYNHLH